MKDDNGLYVAPPKAPKAVDPQTPSDISIDDEMNKGLLAIHRLLKLVNSDIVSQTKLKDATVILKACMDMLKDLKKAESDLLDDLSTEELQVLLDKRKEQ